MYVYVTVWNIACFIESIPFLAFDVLIHDLDRYETDRVIKVYLGLILTSYSSQLQ